MDITKFKLQDIVDSILTNEAKNNDRDYSYFHPSEWHKCHRMIVYEHYRYMGYITCDLSSSITDPGLQKIFGNGHSVHHRCGGYLEKTGLLHGLWVCSNHEYHKKEPKVYGKESKLGIKKPEICDCGCSKFNYREIKFYDEETNWGGSVDAVLDLHGFVDDASVSDENRYVIVDFKSINHFMFGKLSEPKKEHFQQMQVYLYLSGLKYGKFVYENKNNQKWAEFWVERDDQWIIEQCEIAKRLNYIVKTKNSKGLRVLPPRPYKEISSECADCSYCSICWKNELNNK